MAENALSFIQLADPQFGLFARLSGLSEEQIAAFRARGLNAQPALKFTGLADEIRLFSAAISTANVIRPAFVVVCGDIVDQWDDDAQAEEALRIGALLDDGIDLHWVPGNHDVGADARHEVPTDESLARYRSRFGPDNYAFQHGDASFIVLNTAITQHPEEVPGELETQMAFLESELRAARLSQSSHIILFTHHPFFLENQDEDKPEEAHLTIPIERRRPVLELLGEYGVDAVFAGHWHRNNYARDGDFLMVTSAAVGYPLGYDPSGFRIVKVFQDRIEHEYFGFDDMPEAVDMGRA